MNQTIDQICVLHVDDDPDVTDLTATFLEREVDRIVVETATSADEGLARLAENGVDCIVSDYDMPGLDGIEFLEAVREERPDLPFILFTGKGSEGVASEAVSAGVTDYLQKETGTGQYAVLANRIENAVGQYRAERRVVKQERILSLLRDVNQALVGSVTRGEIETAVTDILASADPYRLVWIGEHDAEEDRIVPRTVAGVDDDAVTPAPLPEGESGGGVVGDAIRAEEITTTRRRDPSLEVWTDASIEYETAIVVPLVYHGDRHGVLVLYTWGEGIDDAERGMLDELAGDIAQAMHAAETRRMLRRHRTAVETVPEGVFVLDEDATILLANESATSLVGRSFEDVEGEPFLALIEDGTFDEAIVDWYLDSVRQMLSSTSDRENAWYETEVRLPDGDTRVVEIHLTLRPYDEAFRGTVGIIRDVTEQKERERDLERARERMEFALDATDSYIYEIDLDTGEEMRHGPFERIYGVDPETVDTNAVFYERAVHPDDRAELARIQQEVLPDAPDESMEMEYRTHPDTERDRWLRTEMQIVDDEERSSPRLIGLATDVTERKNREQSIEELHSTAREILRADSNERVAEVVVQAVQGVLAFPVNTVWLRDETEDVLRPIAWTDRASELFGDIPTFNRDEALAWDVLKTGEPKHYDDVSRIDDRYNPETPIRSEVTLPLGDHGVLTIGSTEVATFDDIDISLAETIATHAETALDRLESERNLREAKSQLEAAVEAGNVGTWMWHVPDDRLVMGPEFASAFGVGPDAAREGISIDRYTSSIYEPDRERVERAIEAAMDACGEYEQEYRVRDASGERRWVVARGHVECEAGTPTRFPGVLIDITDRKEYERELERQNERLEEFAAVISHDLRNPLNVAVGRLELIQEECDSQHLAALERSLDRMDALIADLLTLTRAGEAVGELQTVDLAAISEHCWRHVVTESATLDLAVEGSILADRARLQQLLENLVRNAVEHGGTDVTVRIGAFDDDRGFYVEDDGVGIDDADREQVFESGYTTLGQGTGLGLSIVHEIVNAHDWEIDLEESDDGGARFEITGVEFVE